MSTTPTEASEGAAPLDDLAPPAEVDLEPPRDPLIDLDEGAEEEEPDAPGSREETDEEVLEPKVLPVERVLTDKDGNSRSFTQGPFLYFQQIELYGLLGRATNIVLEGENGLGVEEIFKMMQPKSMIQQLMDQAGPRPAPGDEDVPGQEDEGDKLDVDQAAKMLSAFARVISVSPEMLKEFHCIVLDVPKGRGIRNWAMEWGLPRMDRETGDDIMHTFIDQNWGVMEGFFTDELPRLFRRAAKARERHRSTGGRSKP